MAAVDNVTVLAVGERTLAELAEEANREHAAVESAVSAGVQHALAAGEILREARSRCPANQWVSWCSDNLTLSHESVAVYIRIAHYRDLVLAKGAVSLSDAQRLLIGLPAVSGGGRTPRVFDEETEERIRQMRADGASVKSLARMLGVSVTTIYRVVDPEKYRGHLARLTERKKARRAEATARRAEVAVDRAKTRQRHARQAAKTLGGAIAEAYANAERMQDVLGQAHREATDSEARRALSIAGEHHRKMRDEIVRALGVS
jgi:hypothetical protein